MERAPPFAVKVEYPYHFKSNYKTRNHADRLKIKYLILSDEEFIKHGFDQTVYSRNQAMKMPQQSKRNSTNVQKYLKGSEHIADSYLKSSDTINSAECIEIQPSTMPSNLAFHTIVPEIRMDVISSIFPTC